MVYVKSCASLLFAVSSAVLLVMLDTGGVDAFAPPPQLQSSHAAAARHSSRSSSSSSSGVCSPTQACSPRGPAPLGMAGPKVSPGALASAVEAAAAKAAADDEAETPSAMLQLKATPPQRIGLVIEPSPFTHISGYSNRFRELIKYLKKAEDDVSIVTCDDHKDPPTEIENFPIITTKGFRFPLYDHIVLSFDTKGKGWAMAETHQPDVLHVTSPGFIVLSALLYARHFRCPLVFSYHTHLPLYARSYAKFLPGAERMAWYLMKYVHNKADLTLVTSPQIRDELEAHGIKRVDVWRKGIDTDRFNPSFKSAEMRERLSDGHPEAPLLVYVGRLGTEKRLKDLKGVLEQLPEARLALVGKGPDDEALKEYFVGTNTVFTGVMTGTELSQAFASGDVFLMPSDSETLGFVVLESMASGVPVIGVRAGGVPDLIEDGKTGYLVDVGDAKAMADRVKLMLQSKTAYKAMGEAARKETEKWSWESATAYLRNVQYKKAMLNFKFRAFNGYGSPHSRSKWRGGLFSIKRGITAILGFIVRAIRKASEATAVAPPATPAAAAAAAGGGGGGGGGDVAKAKEERWWF